ncbi:pectinesterase inhibitor 9-like [Curcuma longa]|uniref:pectinesterase inhibitor 9-like n=1 Tax=Curcuma longa TaxID=136217 RepID=UPI003D9EB17E
MAQVVALVAFVLMAASLCDSKMTTTGSPTDFVRSSCSATRYPDLCFRCLASYAPAVHHSARHLARAALSVSADRARSASAYITQEAAAASAGGSLREAGAVRDCLDNMADSVDRLRQSAEEMGRVGRAGSASFAWHMGNVRTWCSAALTDENTCLDSLSEHGSAALRAAVRPKVLEVAQVTSNALALVDRVWSKKASNHN